MATRWNAPARRWLILGCVALLIGAGAVMVAKRKLFRRRDNPIPAATLTINAPPPLTAVELAAVRAAYEQPVHRVWGLFDHVSLYHRSGFVEHYGCDRIPPEHAARHGFPLDAIQLRFAEWWQALLASLARRASGPLRSTISDDRGSAGGAVLGQRGDVGRGDARR